MSILNFRPATAADVPAITALTNLAYAGNSSEKAWTHEGTLFDEARTNDAEIAAHIAAPGAMFLLGFDGDQLVASALLKFTDDAGYLGMLAVHPDLQTGGVGKQMLAEAEHMAIARGCTKMTMMVIATHRPELVAYYQRRGYALTGRYGQFSRAAVKAYAEEIGMRLEWMEKKLVAK
ncbi:MAG: GNAT family N-acetyltransferase [Betaproteobacteria bacterium]|nr:GNAT family N-acetyltransferase [Betaproteobacteria bacterium]